MEMIAKVLLALSALISVWFVIKGLMDMQRVNTADPAVIELQGVVRELRHGGSQAIVTINAGEEVRHVLCDLPGPWIAGRRRQVTDLVPVLWRRGENRAVAAETIRDGQTMFIIGFAALALAAVLYMMLF